MLLRVLGVLVAMLALGGCARPKTPAVPPVPDVSGRLAKAGGLMRIGCFDCLEEALAEYDAVRQVPNLRPVDAEAATDGAIGAALLMELRQRELGMADDGYLQRARDLIGTREDRAGGVRPASVHRRIDTAPRCAISCASRTRRTAPDAGVACEVSGACRGTAARGGRQPAGSLLLAGLLLHPQRQPGRSIAFDAARAARPDARPADRRLSDRHVPGDAVGTAQGASRSRTAIRGDHLLAGSGGAGGHAD